VEHKEFCQVEFRESDVNLSESGNDKGNFGASIESLEANIDELRGEIADAQSALA